MCHPKFKGEASDRNHKELLDVDVMKWGVSRAITSSTSTQGDRESSNATISDLILYRYMDKASPYLFIHSCCGTGNDIEIYLTKTGNGEGADDCMVYRLKNALISHYSIQAKSGNLTRPYEKIKISFTAVEVKYISYDENGNAEAPQAVGFDTATNTKV